MALIAKETLTQATAMAPIATPTPTQVNFSMTMSLEILMGEILLTKKNQYLQAAKPLDATSMMAMAMDSTNRLINPLAITVFIKILPAKDLTLLLDLATAALKNEKLT